MTCIIHAHLVYCGYGDEAEEGPRPSNPMRMVSSGSFVEYEVVESESMERDQCSRD